MEKSHQWYQGQMLLCYSSRALKLFRHTQSDHHQRCWNTKSQRIALLFLVDAAFLSCRWTHTENSRLSPTHQVGEVAKVSVPLTPEDWSNNG